MALLETSTSEGALKGMVLARAPHELGDQEVAYLQDALINQPGFVARRGAITGTTAITAANIDSVQPAAIFTVFDPSGNQRVGILYLKDTGFVHEIWMAVFDSSFNFIQKHYMTTNYLPVYPTRAAIITTCPGIDGSILVSVRQGYGIGNTATMAAQLSFTFKWYGAAPTLSFNGAVNNVTLTSTIGSTSATVGAGDASKVSPGMILTGVGVIRSVGGTGIVLVNPALATFAAASCQIVVTEGLGSVRHRGAVTAVVGGANQVTGYGTRFLETYANNAGAFGYHMIDPSDGNLIWSAIGTMVSDTQTFAGAVVKAVSLKPFWMWVDSQQQASRYQAPDGGSYSSWNVKGSMWASYKDYNISFNGLIHNTTFGGDSLQTHRGYIHGPRIPDLMDHSPVDGDWFPVNSTVGGDQDGVACIGGRNHVLLCKTKESFALIGDDVDNFAIQKIADDGALTAESVATWRGASIWLGKTGIWEYDGVSEPVNIVDDTLGQRWNQLVLAFDTKSSTADASGYPLNQARCFVYRDHLFVNVTNTGSQHIIYTDGVARTSNTMQLMIYLPTGAVSFLSNFNFNGFVQVGRQGYVLLPQLGSTTHHIFPLDNLFLQGVATIDVILTANSYNSGTTSTSVGPWFHMESKKYSLGDGIRRKTWKQLSLEYIMTNTKRMFLETVPGLNNSGTRQTTPYVGTDLFKAFKNKFNARDQYMSFRLYEDINNRPATLKLGAWQWAYKLARRGQV